MQQLSLAARVFAAFLVVTAASAQTSQGNGSICLPPTGGPTIFTGGGVTISINGGATPVGGGFSCTGVQFSGSGGSLTSISRTTYNDANGNGRLDPNEAASDTETLTGVFGSRELAGFIVPAGPNWRMDWSFTYDPTRVPPPPPPQPTQDWWPLVRWIIFGV